MSAVLCDCDNCHDARQNSPCAIAAKSYARACRRLAAQAFQDGDAETGERLLRDAEQFDVVAMTITSLPCLRRREALDQKSVRPVPRAAVRQFYPQ